MKWIDTKDIEQWASRRDCQETLPQLIRKLIRATSSSIKSIKFPSGDNVLIGGWDGVLEVLEETEYLPLGVSLWEFGSNKNPKGKADEDYEKRSKSPLGYDPSESTFVFVTPRLWKKGEDWATTKKEEKIWKDVIVINAEVLEEWLETAPTVSAWLAIKHLRKYPNEGIQSTLDFWEEWSINDEGFKITPDVLIAGRKKEKEQLFDFSSKSSLVAVQGASREESLAFVVSCYKTDEVREEDFFARSIIVDSPDAFRQLSVIRTPLIFIVRFEDTGIMNKAVSNGHTVIVPLGADAVGNWNKKIILKEVDRYAFIKALIKSGLSVCLRARASFPSQLKFVALHHEGKQ